MRKFLYLASIVSLALAGPARGQFCPGASGWVFDDVPASDQFCGYITWAAQNGITQGCAIIDANHRLYCPDASVARSQMAAFLRRAFDMPHSTSVDVGTITKPGGSFLHDHGEDSVFLGLNAGNFSGPVVRAVAVGASALSSNTSGWDNVAIGAYALRANDEGFSNSALGSYSLNKNTWGYDNVAVGYSALRLNESGVANVAVGSYAMLIAGPHASFNTAVGSYTLVNSTNSENSAFGYTALAQNTLGQLNTGLGTRALETNTTGSVNTAVGADALGKNVAGSFNTAVGFSALATAANGARNTAVGNDALKANQGSRNVAIGSAAMTANDLGSDNIAIGTDAASSAGSGSFNIHIGNAGLPGDTGVIRVGSANQAKTFLAGVRGITTGSNDAVNVVIDSQGQLGTISSSREGKDDIADMGDASAALMQLRPVTFHYKSDRGPAGPRLQYGLIAEEVADVYPGMVATKDGKPATVMYQYLAPMLLNEYQKQQRTIEEQARNIERQAREIAELKRAVEVLMARTAPENRVAAR